MRVFIAIELSKGIRERLARIKDELKISSGLSWVKPENIHLTLKFLGEVDENRLAKVKEILEDIVSKKNCFLLRLGCLGAFPRITSPRVIWAGLSQGDKDAAEIAAEIEERLAEIGIPKEARPYSSHITIARVKPGANRKDLAERLEILARDFGREKLECPISKITLFKSTLTPQGPVYEALKEAPLQNNP